MGDSENAGMATKERRAEVGCLLARRCVRELGEELHNARLEHGLSQAFVAGAAGISRSQVSRIERGNIPRLSILLASRLMAVVGRELSVRTYATGSPLRDHAQLALLARFEERLNRSVPTRREVPLARPGDQRAWDLVVKLGKSSVAVEAETRPRDLQAVQRRLALKLRDDASVSAVVLLLSDTRYNRELLKSHGSVLRADYRVDVDAMWRALADGRDPGGSGVVLA